MSARPRIALVSAAAARDLDEDLPPLVEALAGAGATASVEVWDDAGCDWAAFDAAVVRSTWDYPTRRDEFLAWADHVASATRLWNPPALLRWSTDKRYLADLADAGVAVTPTHFVAPGEAAVVPWDGEVVVKPSVGAGSVGALRFGPDRHDAAVAHVGALCGRGLTAMVQPYVPSVDDAGETALVHFGGTFSHAVRKGPILRAPPKFAGGGLYAVEDISARTAGPDELALAARALAAAPMRALYARVDVVRGDDGKPMVLELELCEPSVFHAHAPGSAGRFAAAILTGLAGPGGRHR